MGTKVTHVCSVCGRGIISNVSTWTPRAPRLDLEPLPEWCCGARARVETSEATGLGPVVLGQRVEVDLVRGACEDDDGISRGGRVVSRRGVVEAVWGTDTCGDLYVRFEDDDVQVVRWPSTPGYPIARSPREFPSTCARATTSRWERRSG